ncbi:MAG: polysaccharide deacetylase family protein [Clostridiales bacterium]
MFFIIEREKILIYGVFLGLLLLGILGYVVYSPKTTAPVNSQGEGVAIPIIMYHSVCKDGGLACDYVVSTELFTNDMMYLKTNGYTTIFISDIVEYVHNNKPLPKKPIVVTFDDGFLNNLTYVLPILESLDIRAVISVVGIYTERYTAEPDRNPVYAYLTWEDIKELAASQRIEIGNHTYSMHELGARQGSLKKSTENSEQYKELFTANVEKLQKALKSKVGITPSVFAYPYGFVSEESIPLIKNMGFKAALTCNEKMNYITHDEEQLYHLSRFNRPGNIETTEFMQRIAEK